MADNIEKVINELLILSSGSKFNITLPDADLISFYEKKIGFIFPEDYKKALMTIGNVFYGTVSLLSVTQEGASYGELEQALHDARDIGLPDDWLPFCEDNGSYYCLIKDGKVRYWTGDGYNDEIWPSLASWIKRVWIEGN